MRKREFGTKPVQAVLGSGNNETETCFRTLKDKKQYVSVAFIGSIICFICFIFGENKGFKKGYNDADRMRTNESTQSV